MLDDQLTAHAAIRETIGRLQGYLTGATPPCDREFARMRWLLVRQVALHDRIEQGWLDALRPAAGRAMRPATAPTPDIAEQVISWGTCIQDNCWDRYRVDALQLLTRMEKRMAQEEAELAALCASVKTCVTANAAETQQRHCRTNAGA